tara:strand:- start:2806 stop:2925 length:120 start_codon:yes stop_codon:yes gene_type:complete
MDQLLDSQFLKEYFTEKKAPKKKIQIKIDLEKPIQNNIK